MILFFGNFSGGHPAVPLVLLVITLLTSGIITTPLLWLIMAVLLGLGAWQVTRCCCDKSSLAHLSVTGSP